MEAFLGLILSNPTIVAIVGLVAAVLFYRNRAASYRDKAAVLESEKQLSSLISKQEEAEADATQKETEYKRIRDALRNGDEPDGDGAA